MNPNFQNFFRCKQTCKIGRNEAAYRPDTSIWRIIQEANNLGELSKTNGVVNMMGGKEHQQGA